MQGRQLWACGTATVITAVILLSGCGESSSSETSQERKQSPKLPGKHRALMTGWCVLTGFRGELGYWGNPGKHSLVEDGIDVAMDEQGLLANIEEADQVAPFMPWALGLYKYRQANSLKDDPVNACISPAGPRHMHFEGGFRIIQDRNYNRIYVLFGGGNRGWRLIHMDGRQPPNPEEVVGTYYGHSTGHWEGNTLVVESSGFNDRFWFSNGGLPHTAALSLVERFTRTDYNTLEYVVEINDPRTYTRPGRLHGISNGLREGEIDENFCEQVEAMDQYTGR